MSRSNATTQSNVIKTDKRRKNRNPLRRQQQTAGFVFALPWMVGLLFLFIVPIVASLFFSLTDYSILKPGNFIGLQNYKALFLDPTFLKSMRVTFYYTVLYVPLSIILGVLVSMLLNVKFKGQALFRTAVFVPSLVPVIAIMIIWNWLLNPEIGVVNWFLELFGIHGPGWFSSETWAMPALVLVSLWTGVGGSTVIYLAGLKDVPKELYDAADVDGAGLWYKAKYVTLPLLTPVIFFQLIMGIIGAFQQFNLPFLVSGGNGNPNDSLMFFGMYQYNTAFSYLKMGYASAQAWIMFIVIMLITLIIFRSQARWVFYQGKKER